METHQSVAFTAYSRCGASLHVLCHLYGGRPIPFGGGTREMANARLPGLLWRIWFAAYGVFALCF